MLRRHGGSPARRFRPAAEPLEDRVTPAGLPFLFTLDDPAGLFAPYPLLQDNLEAAGQVLSGLLDGRGTIDVAVRPDNFIATAGGAAALSSPVGSESGFTIVEDSTLTETRTGTDPNGSEPDLLISINTESYLPALFLDPSGAARTAPVPLDRVDFLSVALHELIHGLGLNGFRQVDGAGYGTFTEGLKSLYDVRTTFGAGADADILFFNGPAAVARYGGPVPLTSVGPGLPLSGENFFHLGNPNGRPGDDLQSDLLNGLAFAPGRRYVVSDLDLATLEDLGHVLLPQISVSGVEVPEGDAGAAPAVFTMSLSRASPQPVTVDFATADGTAAAGSDYLPTSGTLTFSPGQTTAAVSVAVVGDTRFELDETFLLRLSNPSGGAVAGDRATTLVRNDDPESADPLQFGAAAFPGVEGGPVTVTVTRPAAGPGTVTVQFATSDGSAVAGADYTATSGTLTFAPGETSRTFTVPTLDDTAFEGGETANVTLSNPSGGAGLGIPPAAVLTIIDNDPARPGTIAFGAVTAGAREDGGSVLLPLARAGGSDGSVTVQVAVAGGSATAGSDFTPPPQTLTFVPGQSSLALFIPVLQDALVEPRETFTVTLSNPGGGATLGSQVQAVVTITSEDGTPNQRFVTQTYSDLLLRPADDAGLAFWSELLDRGVTRGVVAAALAHSGEYYAAIVIRPAYRQFLGREGEDGGVQFWVGQMRAGLTDEQVQASFVAAPEFYNNAGGSDLLFVRAVYDELLGRRPAAAEERFWVDSLAAGVPRAQVALGFTASPERVGSAVAAAYERYLGRSATAGEAAFWVDAFRRGATQEDIATGVIGSDEYFRRATG